MKIEKKQAWKNNKCNECGRLIFSIKDEEKIIYYCYPENSTSFKAWKLCKKCYKEIFKEKK